jgi:hypothetical protein
MFMKLKEMLSYYKLNEIRGEINLKRNLPFVTSIIFLLITDTKNLFILLALTLAYFLISKYRNAKTEIDYS